GELAMQPKQAVPYLAKQLAAVPPPDEKTIGKLIGDLAADETATWKKAAAELERYGDQAEKPLLQALADTKDADVKLRRQVLLGKLKKESVSAEQAALRATRAVGVLEWVGTAEARKVLAELAGGSAEALARDARAALGRLERRDEKP